MSQAGRVGKLEQKARRVRDRQPVDVGQLAVDLVGSFAEAERLPVGDHWARGLLALRDALHKLGVV